MTNSLVGQVLISRSPLTVGRFFFFHSRSVFAQFYRFDVEHH
jgi:hypothetical protein